MSSQECNHRKYKAIEKTQIGMHNIIEGKGGDLKFVHAELKQNEFPKLEA
jgi:hypothetical protein